MNLKEYFKERLMEEISESFATDAERGTPEGRARQGRHAGIIKGLLVKYNEDPTQFKKSKAAADRLENMATRAGMSVRHDVLSDRFKIDDGTGVHPDKLPDDVTAERPLSFNRKTEAERKVADFENKSGRMGRWKAFQEKQASQARENERKSWEV